MARERADLVLVALGLAPSRAKAREMISAGEVSYTDGRRVSKASQLIEVDAELRVTGDTLRYVSRGGHKLAAALKYFGLPVSGSVCLDVGASTGGFTDCLLQHGARRVFAVDVGRGQLASPLCSDPRVINLENTDIRGLCAPEIDVACNLVTIDVSFISLRLVLPALSSMVKPDAHILALVKPQFEVGLKGLGKGGIVRSRERRLAVLEEIVEFSKEQGFQRLETMESPIVGSKGNREFFLTAIFPPISGGDIV